MLHFKHLFIIIITMYCVPCVQIHKRCEVIGGFYLVRKLFIDSDLLETSLTADGRYRFWRRFLIGGMHAGRS